MPWEECKTRSLCRSTSLACLPSVQLIAALGFPRPATVLLCSASPQGHFAFGNSSEPCLNPHKLLAFSTLGAVHVLHWEAGQYKSWAELPRAVLKLVPAFACAGLQCRGNAGTCLEMLPAMTPARAAKRAPFSAISYFLMLSEGLQAYNPRARGRFFPEVLPWAPASKHLLIHQTSHSGQRDNTCEHSHACHDTCLASQAEENLLQAAPSAWCAPC